MHTVFSDGHVWPSFRVNEAIRDGLDVISLTEHIDYEGFPEVVVQVTITNPMKLPLMLQKIKIS